MRYTAAHWGAYEFDGTGDVRPVSDDPSPSRIGKGWVSAVRDENSRILAPVARQGWLDGDRGAGRCGGDFVEIDWERAIGLVSAEIERVRDEHGNGAIFGGSYGWASAGRFHHAQSQLRRFLNLAGGYVGARDTYSHAAAEVLFPYIIGLSNRAFQDQMTSLDLVAENCDLLLSFGGISERTAQISSAGTSKHEVGSWLDRLKTGGASIVNVSPRGSDFPGAEWLAIRPGTDTALMLALAFEIAAADQADEEFLQRCTSGWGEFRSYLTGESDGQEKSAVWAAPICDIPAPRIRELASALADRRSMISVNWGLQRADHGEQTIWAGLALACIIGQIGLPGTGYSFGYGSTTPVGRSGKLIAWPALPQGENPIGDFVPVARIADMLMHPGRAYTYDGELRRYPDIRLIYWAGGNPFHHHQDLNRLEKVWARPETIIVHDHSWTATARRADIVLPATTPLERADIMMNRRDPGLFFMSPLFEPMGQALDDHEIFRRLAACLGFEHAFTEGRGTEDWLRHLWAGAQAVAQSEGFALPAFEAFKEEGRFDVPDAKAQRVAFDRFVSDPEVNPLKTETGKITLFNRAIAGLELADCPGHPCWKIPAESLLDSGPDELHLISGQPDTRLHAQNDRGSEAQADKVRGREPAYMHPHAAAARGLAEGDIVRLWNARGACLAGLRFDDSIRIDCISLATGAWFDPQEIDGATIETHGNPNVLTLDKGCSGLSQGNVAHTALVRVEKWTGSIPQLAVDRPPAIKPK